MRVRCGQHPINTIARTHMRIGRCAKRMVAIGRRRPVQSILRRVIYRASRLKQAERRPPRLRLQRVVFTLLQTLVVIRHIPVTFHLVVAVFGGVAFMHNVRKRVIMVRSCVLFRVVGIPCRMIRTMRRLRHCMRIILNVLSINAMV